MEGLVVGSEEDMVLWVADRGMSFGWVGDVVDAAAMCGDGWESGDDVLISWIWLSIDDYKRPGVLPEGAWWLGGLAK